MSEQNNPKNLKEIIDHIIKSTQTIIDRDFDETATKQFVVLPILRALGWDDSNLETLEVLPEIPTDPESGKQIKVDYALQHEGKVLVMIECKRWRENLEKSEHHEQLAGYIFQRGVDIGVLTNGNGTSTLRIKHMSRGETENFALLNLITNKKLLQIFKNIYLKLK